MGPATWFPRRRPRGSPAFFGRKPEERTPGRREVLSALDPPFLVWGDPAEVRLLFCLACGPVSYARNGPPTGWAGWERQEFWDPLRWAPKIGDAPRPAPAKLALSGREVCFGRRSRSKHDWIFFPRLRAGKLCEACPAGRVCWAEGDWIPYRSVSHVQSLPLGSRTVRGTVRSGPGEATMNHRCPSAHTGADEGAIWYPTFPCRKEGATSCRLNEVFLLPRWASRSPPHPSPSVLASPQGEAFAGGTPPQRNAFSPKPCSRKMRIQIRARRWATK